MSMFTTTTNLSVPYKVIDTVFAVDSNKESLLGGKADPNKAFQGVKEQLIAKCQQLGGDGVIGCQFEYRVAVGSGTLGGKRQVMEIFAYGTVIKLG